MSAPGATSALFVCDGAPVPPALADARWDVEDIIVSADPKAELNLRMDTLSGNLSGSVSARAEDLLYIACCCMAADQRINRGTKQTDVHRRRWRRQFTLVVPVHDPSLWSQPEVTEALAHILAFATDDAWTFAFVPRRWEARPQLLFGKNDDRAVRGDPDSIILFSGGMDSLCAAVESVAEMSMRPTALSFKSATQVSRTQKKLIEAIRERFPNWRLPHIGFSSHRSGGNEPDPSQRTRAFAVAALGCAVAESLGVESVVLADNGYVSINPPITGELAGALASRGTHPTLLRLLNRFVQLVFDQPVVVTNPLADRTRAEGLELLKQYECADLIQLSMTCGKFRSPYQSLSTPHCGVCSQCVDRRFAVIRAGLEKFDPADRYVVDIFLDELSPGEARKIALMYTTFAQQCAYLTPEEIFGLVDQLSACLDPEAGDVQQEAYSLGHLLRRHSREVTAVLSEMIARYSGKLATGELPAASLLRYATAGPTSMDDATTTANEGAPERSEQPIMQRSGNYWHFTFQGEKATVRHLKGFTYLAMLLGTPHTRVHARLLASGGTADIEASDAQVRDAGLNMEAIRDEILPRDGEEYLTEQLDLLAVERAAGVGPERAQAIDTAMEQIRSYIAKSKGLSGRRRSFSENDERARVAVTQAVNKALGELQMVCPALHQHLDATLSKGQFFQYAPHPPLRWDVAT